MSRPPRWVFVVVALVGAAAACVLFLPGTAWLLITQYGSPTPGQYLAFAAANLLIAAAGSMPGVLGLAFFSGPQRPPEDGGGSPHAT